MAEEAIKIGGKKKSIFLDKVKELLPEGGNLNLCLTCGACSSGCPATGLADMDPRKFLRMAALGMDEERKSTPWVWMCTMCQRCIYVCPMQIDIPQLVYNARASWPREERPKGILGSCDMALRNDSCSAMGTAPDDFKFVVEDVLEGRLAQVAAAGQGLDGDDRLAEFSRQKNCVFEFPRIRHRLNIKAQGRDLLLTGEYPNGVVKIELELVAQGQHVGDRKSSPLHCEIETDV